MNRSIVCGVDGTPASRWAARVAGEMAPELGYELVLVYVADDPPTSRMATPDCASFRGARPSRRQRRCLSARRRRCQRS